MVKSNLVWFIICTKKLYMWFIKMLMNPNIIAYLRSSYPSLPKKEEDCRHFHPLCFFSRQQGDLFHDFAIWEFSESMRSRTRRASSSVAGTTFRILNPSLMASWRTVNVKQNLFDTCSNHVAYKEKLICILAILAQNRKWKGVGITNYVLNHPFSYMFAIVSSKWLFSIGLHHWKNI